MTNPVTNVRHLSQHKNGDCLGLAVHVWCPGCDRLHMPRFRCPEHGGPKSGPVWQGNPHSNPFSMEPSYLVYEGGNQPRCHSFIRNGHWEFLSDCGHSLHGQVVPLVPLPDWLM